MSRGRVFLIGRTYPDCQPFWAFEVTDGQGKVVLTDNCTDVSQMHDRARAGAKAIEIIEKSGHVLQHSYQELVEKIVTGRYHG